MGQKVHPESMRVGYIHDWKSNWFSEKNFSDYLVKGFDSLGKTLGGALVRMEIDVPDDVAANARRRHAPINR